MSKIYHISQHYKKVTVWSGSPITGARMMVSTCTPDKGMTRQKRYDVIAGYLAERHAITRPDYRPIGQHPNPTR